MAKLDRVTAKVFAASAAADEIGQFGSAVAGSKLETADVATIQGLSAWLDGWSEALVPGNRYPALQEMNGLLKVLSYQGAYTLQEGIPEYDSATTYYIGSIIKKTGTFELYGSLTDDNVGNALIDGVDWKFLLDLADFTPILDVNFALNSGNLSATGDSDILAKTTTTTLSFKIDDGTTYQPLLITYADKTQQTLTSLANITGLSTNGTYTIIKEKDSATAVAVASSTITQGKTFEASPTDGDYHCLTATGLQTFKRVSDAWVETQYVPIGTVTVAGGVISAVSTKPYNQNGYDRPYKYDSGWFAVSASSNYTKTHNLGTSNIKYIVLIADDANGTNQRPVHGYSSNFSTTSGGWAALTTSSTEIKITTGGTYIGLNASGYWINTGYYRILAEVI